MALSSLLRLYLQLERQMLTLDAVGDASADDVRDVMDPLWYRLSDQDRSQLDDRRKDEIPWSPGLVLSISAGFFDTREEPPSLAIQRHAGSLGLEYADWRLSA